MKKKIMSLLLVLVIFAQLLPLGTVTALDNNAEIQVNEVYISTAKELYEFAQKVNTDNISQNTVVYLMANVDTADYDKFATIGIASQSVKSSDGSTILKDFPFMGTFFGNGHTITLNINSTDGKKALFGCTFDAKIMDLGVDGTVKAGQYAAGIVAIAQRTDIINCHSAANITSSYTEAGGIIAKSELGNRIINCSAEGSVYAVSSAGGLVGTADGDGLIIENCYSHGKVTTGNNVKTGAVIGYYTGSNVKNVYYNGEQNKTLTAIGDIPDTNTVCALYDYERMAESGKEGAVIDILNSCTVPEGVIKREWICHSDGTLQIKLPYMVINSAEGYAEVARKSIEGDRFLHKIVMLESDIDISNINGLIPVGNEANPFMGYFDGNGKTVIYNIKDSKEVPALFGVVENGMVSHLTVKGSIENSDSVAGIVYKLRSGRVENCTNFADVLSSGVSAAGIVGISEGNSVITGCVNKGTVKALTASGGIVASAGGNTVVKYCENGNTVSGGNTVGGIAGEIYGNASVYSSENLAKLNCSKNNCGGIAGTVSDSASVTNCENLFGTDVSCENAGGIAGEVKDSAVIANCIVKAKVSGKSAVGGIAGKNSATIRNCYSSATVGKNNNCGIIAGINTGITENCFYSVSDGSDKPFGNKTGEATAVRSGECEVVCNTNNAYIDRNFDNTSDWKVWEIRDGLPTLTDREKSTPFASGDGSEKNPYVVSTFDQLKYLAFSVADGKTYRNRYIILDSDIIGDGQLMPIGCKKIGFEGNFDGNGHTITINAARTAEYGGVFGRTDGAVIENLNVDGNISATAFAGGIVGYAENTEIGNCHSSASIKVGDAESVGGIVGQAEKSHIYGCGFDGETEGGLNVGGIAGKTTGCTIENCGISSSQLICSKRGNAGGIVGFALSSTIDTCTNRAVYVYCNSGSNVGGIAGIASDSTLIINCRNFNNIGSANVNNVGGIVGKLENNGKIYNSVNNAFVSGNKNVGGIAGTSDNGVINNCYTRNGLRAASNGGIILGEATSAGAKIVNCSYRKSDYSGTSVCGNRNISGAWGVSDAEAEGAALTAYHNNYIAASYPSTKGYDIWGFDENGDIILTESDVAYEFAGGEGTEVKPYQISNLAELKYLSMQIIERKNDFKDQYIVLTNDIVCDQTLAPIGTADIAFKGYFDGQGHTVTLDMNRSSEYGGLFGNVNGGSISNLVVDGRVGSSASMTGGIAGFIDNTIITNCLNKADVEAYGGSGVGGIVGKANGDPELFQCRNSGKIIGTHNVGGIVGFSEHGTRINCCQNNVDAEVRATSESAGGIIGQARNGVQILNCVNFGKVRSDQYTAGGIAGSAYVLVYNCANYGEVKGEKGQVGGIVGGAESDPFFPSEYGHLSITNCYNSADVFSTEGLYGLIAGEATDATITNYNYYNKNKNAHNASAIGQYSKINGKKLEPVSYNISGYSDAECRGTKVRDMLNDYINNPKGDIPVYDFAQWGWDGDEHIRPRFEGKDECKHSLTETERVSATFSSEGKHEYFYCSRCKKYYADEKALCYIGDEYDFEFWKENAQTLPIGRYYYFERVNGEFTEKYLDPGEYTYIWDVGDTLDTDWYVVAAKSQSENTFNKGTVTISQNQNVRLLLADGAKLNVSSGIQICGGATLTVYGQDIDDPTGMLVASSDIHTAGIGAYNRKSYGDNDLGGGTLIINGGLVEARGGDDCAGISGTNNIKVEVNHWLIKVEINGGIVRSWGGRHGAGIGGGAYGVGENITINGGTVYAWAGGSYGANDSYGAAGIGGAYGGDGKNITINGGTVYAYASGSHLAADAYKAYNDGIGGAFGGHAQNIKLNGGFITSIGADRGSAFGGTDGFVLSDNFNLWAGTNQDNATLQANYTGMNQKYARLIEGKGNKYSVTYVDNTKPGTPLLVVDQYDAGALVRKPDCVSVGTIGYCDWFTDKTVQTEFPFGNFLITENVTVYGKAHIHNDDDNLSYIEGKETQRGVNGYFSAYKCNYCGLYFETSGCEGLIGQESEYNNWKQNGGRRIYYVDFEDGELYECENTSFVKTLTASDTVWGEDGVESWYVLEGNIDVYSRITVKGYVFLILKDGFTLNAHSGITVDGYAELYIYAQSDGDSAGTVKAQANGYAAGIGGEELYGEAGYIVIGSGNIQATGGSFADGSANGGAGIGASCGGTFCEVVINGGNVTATGGDFAAGIGGSFGSIDGSVTVSGGTVYAKSGLYAAGIGGSMFSEGRFSIRITGGKVTAIGGGTADAIGRGDKDYDKTGYSIKISKQMVQTESSGNTVCYIDEYLLSEDED